MQYKYKREEKRKEFFFFKKKRYFYYFKQILRNTRLYNKRSHFILINLHTLNWLWYVTLIMINFIWIFSLFPFFLNFHNIIIQRVISQIFCNTNRMITNSYEIYKRHIEFFHYIWGLLYLFKIWNLKEKIKSYVLFV